MSEKKSLLQNALEDGDLILGKAVSCIGPTCLLITMIKPGQKNIKCLLLEGNGKQSRAGRN